MAQRRVSRPDTRPAPPAHARPAASRRRARPATTRRRRPTGPGSGRPGAGRPLRGTRRRRRTTSRGPARSSRRRRAPGSRSHRCPAARSGDRPCRRLAAAARRRLRRGRLPAAAGPGSACRGRGGGGLPQSGAALGRRLAARQPGQSAPRPVLGGPGRAAVLGQSPALPSADPRRRTAARADRRAACPVASATRPRQADRKQAVQTSPAGPRGATGAAGIAAGTAAEMSRWPRRPAAAAAAASARRPPGPRPHRRRRTRSACPSRPAAACSNVVLLVMAEMTCASVSVRVLGLDQRDDAGRQRARRDSCR